MRESAQIWRQREDPNRMPPRRRKVFAELRAQEAWQRQRRPRGSQRSTGRPRRQTACSCRWLQWRVPVRCRCHARVGTTDRRPAVVGLRAPVKSARGKRNRDKGSQFTPVKHSFACKQQQLTRVLCCSIRDKCSFNTTGQSVNLNFRHEIVGISVFRRAVRPCNCR